MNGFEPVKECIYQYTDAGQWGVQWDEEIIRCQDCKNYESDYNDGATFGASVCWGWDNGHDYPCFTHPNGFCHRGVKRAIPPTATETDELPPKWADAPTLELGA